MSFAAVIAAGAKLLPAVARTKTRVTKFSRSTGSLRRPSSSTGSSGIRSSRTRTVLLHTSPAHINLLCDLRLPHRITSDGTDSM